MSLERIGPLKKLSVLSSAPKSSAKSFVFSTAFRQGSPTFHALRMSQSDMTTQSSVKNKVEY